MPQEEATLPGEWPGIYACDRRKLLTIYNATLRAALSSLKGDAAAAEVRVQWCSCQGRFDSREFIPAGWIRKDLSPASNP